MAFSIVRITNFTVSSISVLFNDDVDTSIGIDNVSIESTIDSISSPDIISIIVENDTINLTFSPLFPNVQYILKFFSTSTTFFKTISGEIISEDGHRNSIFIVSPGETIEPIRDSMFDDLPSVYNVEEPTLVRSLVSGMANQLQNISDSVGVVRAGNYLSILVTDENVVRGDGPVDKLTNEGAFEIIRVSSNITGSYKNRVLEFGASRTKSFSTRYSIKLNPIINSLPSEPISLQAEDVINETVTDDSSLNNHFSRLKIKVANKNVMQVISVALVRNDVYYEYDISEYGYTLLDNRYDIILAGINVNLKNNEIELSSKAVSGGFPTPQAGDEIKISYVYKKLGISINSDSVQLTTTKSIAREIAPAIANRFFTLNAPITNNIDQIVSSNGIQFFCTQTTATLKAFVDKHPAFVREIKFNSSRFPTRPGEYSINYQTGEINVFGEDQTNSGTGYAPPAMDYLYRKIYINNLDYVFDSDISELALNSTRNLSGIQAKISFQYEDVFADGEDFISSSHIESLNERVENRLINDFQIKTLNYPITNVFRIFNESTGEIYSITRFNDSTITFSGNNPPKQVEVAREKISFLTTSRETLLVSDELSNIYNKRIFKINLSNNGILDKNGHFMGSNFNSSITFSNETLFMNEFFYEDIVYNSVSINLNKLTLVGDFVIDYENGIIYVVVSSSQDLNIGDVTYKCKIVETRNKHILGVYDIYRSSNPLLSNIKSYNYSNILDGSVDITGVESVGQRFINNDILTYLRVGTYQSGVDGIASSGSNIFTSNSAIFSSSDIGNLLYVGHTNYPPIEAVIVTGIINSHQVMVDQNFTSSFNGITWSLSYSNPNSEKTLILDNNILSVNAIYKISELDGYLTRVSSSHLTNYYDINTDQIIDNTIILDAYNSLAHGDAVLVDYNYGDLFINYQYLADEVLVSYEYGNNSLNWSINNTLAPGQQYYITYKYGALRDLLTTNFGALTQIKQLETFSPSIDRETYRSVLGGTLQSFITGPTIPSIKTLVKSFTNIDPEIVENNVGWVLGQSNLNLDSIKSSASETYDFGKFNQGLRFSSGQSVEVSALSHIKINEGTLETWIKPSWNGVENDSVLTFNLLVDGYARVENVFIGFSGENPGSIPFTLQVNSDNIFALSQPAEFGNKTGIFIWFDNDKKVWQIICRQYTVANKGLWTQSTFYDVGDVVSNDGYNLYLCSVSGFSSSSGTGPIGNSSTIYDGYVTWQYAHTFSGTITTSGEFFSSSPIVDPDGIEHSNNIINTLDEKISFEVIINGYDTVVDENNITYESFNFKSGDFHYIFDMASGESSNRISLFKDGQGFLNFRVFDDKSRHGLNAGFYNLSANISDWKSEQLYHVATSWKFNSPEEKDEMHLFIDGQEIPNLLKYGGKPIYNPDSYFGSIAEEIIIDSSSSSIVGGFDGISTQNGYVFTSNSNNFQDSGIIIGDKLFILDNTQDGTDSPNYGLPYNILGVGQTTILLDRPTSLTLSNIHFSINQFTKSVETPINIQKFIVIAQDAYGNETELNGINSDFPDYSIPNSNYLFTYNLAINNNVKKGDKLILRTLGLLFKRFIEKIYVYGGYDYIRTNSSPPTSLNDIKITEIIVDNTLINETDGFVLSDGYMDGYLDGYCQPSNSVDGRKLLAMVISNDDSSGNNSIDFSKGNVEITIHGSTFSGATSETILISSGEDGYTNEFWTNIESIYVHVPVSNTYITDILSNPELSAGTIVIREKYSITESENSGEFAKVVDYTNGVFRLEISGSGGEPFVLNGCTYEIDYPSYLKINITSQPRTFMIGSDFNKENTAGAVLDEFRILDYISTDTRVGESLGNLSRTITTDYLYDFEFVQDYNTLLLLHFNSDNSNSSDFIDRFNSGYEVAKSVNNSFNTGIKITDRPFIINNAEYVFNNDEGTIEFWISPLRDGYDPNYHYFIDMAAIVQEEATSITKITVIASQKVYSVESVRLASDIYNTGTNYFAGGFISNIDGKTLTLGIPLPLQNTPVKVTYIPASNKGDRVSLYSDSSNFINFYMKANNIEYLLSSHTEWKRHTWHRIMVMWKTNTGNNLDRLRLFVDGEERGTIKYGTGLMYGSGIVYGQEEVRPGINRFIVENIDLNDVFARIYVGSDVFGINGANAILDNLRFSNIQRLQSVRVSNGANIDVNYQANTDFAIPVVSDINTTELYDFDTLPNKITDITTLINAEKGIFKFTVNVTDSFNRVIGNSYLESLLTSLINIIKPANCTAIVRLKK